MKKPIRGDYWDYSHTENFTLKPKFYTEEYERDLEKYCSQLEEIIHILIFKHNHKCAVGINFNKLYERLKKEYD